MAIFDFDALKEKAMGLAQAGVAKSKVLAEIAKLKAANMSEEDAIKKAYIELGKLYYAERGAAPEAAYVSGCERIAASKAAIEANNARIAELKTKEDVDDEAGEAHTVVVEPEDVADAAPAEEQKDDDTVQ